jgi:hypothetical protein
MHAVWKAVRVEGAGTIGWRLPKRGQIALHVEAPDLSPFDSVAMAVTGFVRDTLRGDVTMAGRGRADVTLEGALGALTVGVAATVDSVHWLGYRGKNLTANLSLVLADSTFDAAVKADSLYWRNLAFADLAGAFRGRTDSLHWEAGATGRNQVSFQGGGRLELATDTRLFHADSLRLGLQNREWKLSAPFDARVSDAGIGLDTVRVATTDGSGTIEVAGAIPGQSPGDLAVTALGIEIRDVYDAAADRRDPGLGCGGRAGRRNVGAADVQRILYHYRSGVRRLSGAADPRGLRLPGAVAPDQPDVLAHRAAGGGGGCQASARPRPPAGGGAAA